MRYIILFYLVLTLSLLSVQGFLGRFIRRQYHQNYIQKLNSKGNLNVDKLFIEQAVDNFNKSDSRKWKNLYVKYDNYFKKDGPIILYINGEDALDNGYPNLVDILAQKTSALVVIIEHRYYGDSIPSDDLKYLSSKQALADMANLIIELKKNDELKNSKVVTVGCSYAGMLSAWMRAHYPHLVDAAISSSAPLLAKTDFYEYLDKVSEAFEKHGTPGCADKLRNNIKEFKNVFSSDKSIQEFKEKMNICESTDLKNKYNQQHVITNFAVNSLCGPVQYGSPEEVKETCQSWTENIEFLSKDIFNISEAINPYVHDDNCIKFDFESETKIMSESQSSDRSWSYQYCNEFGYLQTSSNKSIFENIKSLDYVSATCKIAFGIDKEMVDDNVKATNEYYGGLKLNVTKVIFFNGGMDPWSALGLTHGLNELSPLNIVPDVSHCAELEVLGHEPKELAEVRDIEINTVIQWLQS